MHLITTSAAQAFRFYADEYRRLVSGKSFKTKQLVNYILDKHLLLYFGDKLVTDITLFDLRAYVAHKSQKYKVFNHLKYFRAVMKVARDMRVKIDTFELECPDMLSDKSVLYDHKQIATIIHACRKRKLWTTRFVVYFAYSTGLRKTEILKLPWEYVDLERGILRLPANYFKRTKAVKPRNIYMSKQQARILRARRERDPNGEWVCPGKVPGRPQTAIERSWQRVKKKHGIIGTFHSLRGTCASQICQIGIDAEETCKMLGMTVDVFRRNYLKVSPRLSKFAFENHIKMSREPVGETIKFVRDVKSREISVS